MMAGQLRHFPTLRHDDRDDDPRPAHRLTETPIEHLIVIIGENRSFDHTFATYKPKHGSPSTTSSPRAS